MPLQISKCRICGNPELLPILDLGEQYLTGVFPKSPADRITRGPLKLVKCHGPKACGLLQLEHSYDSSEMYGQNYGYRSGLNRSMVDHLRAKVAKLSGLVPLQAGDLVLDIGSNDGTSLSFYPESGPTLVGMDPTAEKFRRFYKPHINVVPDFFSASRFESEFPGRKAKIVSSIAMFYDLEEPMAFVNNIAAILAEDGIWHFEQSYMPTMLAETAYDTVCHEHLEYYGLRQIKWMLDRCGLKIIDVELNDVNGGSFAVTAARQSSSLPVNETAVNALLAAEDRVGLSTAKPYEEFRQRVFAHRDELVSLINGLVQEGAKIIGYGASTKGNVILQFCNFTKDQIPYFADVNPDKFGSFTPGTNIPIISEADAHAMNPDYFLVMPWHFRTNLLAREEAFLKRGGKMIFPLPKIEVVG